MHKKHEMSRDRSIIAKATHAHIWSYEYRASSSPISAAEEDDEQEGIATVEEGRIKGLYFASSSMMHYDCDRQTKSDII